MAKKVTLKQRYDRLQQSREKRYEQKKLKVVKRLISKLQKLSRKRAAADVCLADGPKGLVVKYGGHRTFVIKALCIWGDSDVIVNALNAEGFFETKDSTLNERWFSCCI